ncbi:MAG: DUF4126 domain-containing protein [Chloroflexi bacterium]|nr:DUF4126 domain-containing protein [Chloroflexota bacterium]MBI2757844.1 DUF4126 domain-containing protein [Chloroflexota bacterium]
MNVFLGIFSAFGLSASAGLNAYIPLLVVGVLAHYTNLIKLSAPWDTLANPYILILLGILLIIEMLADKIPAVNHINDLIQTFVRPAAGAIAFAASANVITGIHPALALAMGLLAAGSVHAVKSLAVRPLVTVATGGAGNVPVSLAEDVASTAISFLSIIVPIVIVILVAVLIIFLLWRWARRTSKDAAVPTER